MKAGALWSGYPGSLFRHRAAGAVLREHTRCGRCTGDRSGADRGELVLVLGDEGRVHLAVLEVLHHTTGHQGRSGSSTGRGSIRSEAAMPAGAAGGGASQGGSRQRVGRGGLP